LFQLILDTNDQNMIRRGGIYDLFPWNWNV